MTRAKSTPSTKSTSRTTATAKASAPPAASLAPAPAPILFIAPPPADANIPAVPSGVEPTSGAGYRVAPRTAELVALPLAIKNLLGITNYAAVFGPTAPPLDEVLQAFQVSNDWSQMRNVSSAWDAYACDQEGVAWTGMRSVMARLKGPFDLAVKASPSVGTTLAGVATLLGVKTTIANRSAATRKRNKADVAEGKAPTHGAVAKAQQKAAAKAALAALNATAATTAKTPAPPVVTSAAPVASSPSTPAPVAASTDDSPAPVAVATHS